MFIEFFWCIHGTVSGRRNEICIAFAKISPDPLPPLALLSRNLSLLTHFSLFLHRNASKIDAVDTPPPLTRYISRFSHPETLPNWPKFSNSCFSKSFLLQHLAQHKFHAAAHQWLFPLIIYLWGNRFCMCLLGKHSPCSLLSKLWVSIVRGYVRYPMPRSTKCLQFNVYPRFIHEVIRFIK